MTTSASDTDLATSRYDLHEVRITGNRAIYDHERMRRLFIKTDAPAPWYRRLKRAVERWVATH